MSQSTFGPGVEITGRITPEYARILTPEAVAFAAKLQRAFGPPGRAPRDARDAAGRVRRRQAARLPAGDARGARRRLDLRAGPRRHPGSPRRDHRPGRPQDDRQRAQLGRERLHGGLRGREHAALGQQHPGPHQPARRDPPQDRLHVSPEGKAYKLGDKLAVAVRAPARLAPAGEAREGRRPADLRRHLRLRAVLLPQREGAGRARLGPVLLPAEAREPPRGAAVERHLRDGAGQARHPARHDQGDRADRDDRRRVRDGRDPVRAARALGGAQRRPLGLHLLLHQEAAQQPRLLPRRPRAGHDDHALPEELRRAPDQDLPPPQHPRDGRHGGADPGQERREGERRGVREGEGRQGARGDLRPRRHVGRASGPRARSRWKRSTA